MKPTNGYDTDSDQTQAPLSGRKLLLWVLGIALALLVILFFGLKFIVQTGRSEPTYLTGGFLFFLSMLNILLILFILFILSRDLVKLLLDRRRKTLGSKFRTKLVLAFIGLSFIPSIFIFFVAFDFISDSVSQWFNTDLDAVLHKTQEVVDDYLDEQADRCSLFARNFADQIESDSRLISSLKRESTEPSNRMMKAMEGMVDHYGIDCLVLYKGRELHHLETRPPVLPATLEGIHMQDLVEDLLRGNSGSKFVRLDDGLLVFSGTALVPHPDRGWYRFALVTGVFVPQRIGNNLDDVANANERYQRARAFKEDTVRVYRFTFLLITLLILFAAVWIGRTMAKEITVPIQLLAEGTREIAGGNLDYKVAVKAGDELGILVDSFNRMTGDLKKSKDELEDTAEDLLQTNVELDERGRYMATVLENISTGVFSLDQEGLITTLNRATREILRMDPSRSRTGVPYLEVFASEELNEICETIRRATGLIDLTMKKDLTLKIRGSIRNLFLTLTTLKTQNERYRGMVVVIDDLTQVIKAQRSAAWQEVARRLAHEIKNPLTPIQLSAQRLRRKTSEGEQQDWVELVDECTTSIEDEVKALKRLVDEFTRYARMPLIRKKSVDLNDVIASAIMVYDEMRDQLSIEKRFAKDLPSVAIDPEQFRRVLINLMDNAIQSMKEPGRMEITTEHRKQMNQIRLTVADDGPGISPEVRDKLFIPYFSTKKKGTGLGLAIVHRIILDHGGTIRMEENVPRGTRVVIDIPV